MGVVTYPLVIEWVHERARGHEVVDRPRTVRWTAGKVVLVQYDTVSNIVDRTPQQRDARLELD